MMNKVALITGSTRGIGRSIAIDLAKAGYDVIINGTNLSLIDHVVHDIQQSGGRARGYLADISDPVAVTDMIQSIMVHHSHIDVFIHSAGNLHDTYSINMTDQEWQAVMDVHVNGAFYSITRILPYMKERGGDMILMTSTAGMNGSQGQLNYSVAKAGILGMVWTLAAELERYGIRVNGIAPAALTDMTRPVIERIEAKCKLLNKPFLDFWKVDSADDVARFVVALLAESDMKLTGEIIGVNGSNITRWQRPVPAFSTDHIESFFATWHREKRK